MFICGTQSKPLVKQPGAGIDAQDAPRLVVNHRLGHPARFNGLQKWRGKSADAARYGNVQAGQRSFLRGAGLQPIGHHQAVEAPSSL